MPAKASSTKKLTSRSQPRRGKSTTATRTTTTTENTTERYLKTDSRESHSTFRAHPTSSKSARPSPIRNSSPSRKSASDSSQPQRKQPRRNRVLKRKPTYHAISDEDLKWVWAAYRKDGLRSLKEFFPSDIQPEEFQNVFVDFIESGIHCWVCDAQTPRGYVPVGLAMGVPTIHKMIALGDFNWFPWASSRNIYESTVNIINDLRGKTNLLMTVDLSNKRFAEKIAANGIMRRVGTLHGVEDDPIAVFQSRN